MNELSLSGLWTYHTDWSDTGIQNNLYTTKLADGIFSVPGTACENNIGTEQPHFTEMTKETVRSLRQHHDYNGVLWLQREFTIPEDWHDKAITLYMERVMWFSDVWIDETKIGRQYDSLCTPHIYDLPCLSGGTHTLTVRIDNRNHYALDNMASGFTNDTQSVWNGIIGDVKLTAQDKFHISRTAVYPDIHHAKITVKLTIDTPLCSPNSKETATVSLAVTGFEQKSYSVTLHHTRQIVSLDYDMNGDIQLWDEFHPVLYTLTACLQYENNSDSASVSFGMREIKTEGRQFMLNGKRIFLRGTLDCCVYPKTGYPPTDLAHWLKVCNTLKEYGLNHIRFHSWCPPESAFTAADMTGIYVLAELPLWLNVDVCALATGDDPIHYEFAWKEAVRISRTFGNHPSFLFFSNGNELLGDFELLETVTTQIKALDSRRLYTLTSNFDRAITPADDYFSAFRANGHGIRCQYFHDRLTHDTTLDYTDGIRSVTVPTVSFEVGQYCVYPDVREISNYDGNLLPVNFEVIRDHLMKKNLLHRVGDFVYASGKLAALLYKEDIEAALRTHDMSGIELLGLHDYPGQCTATVGLLNSFWESKNIMNPVEFREFCSPVVPLLKTNRIYHTADTFSAEFDLADFGDIPIVHPIYQLDLYNGEQLLYHTETTDTHIEFSLSFISSAIQAKAVLSIKNTSYQNRWDIFIYPDFCEPENHIVIADRINDAVLHKIKNGGKICILATADTLANPIQGKFYPVFWSPAYFPSSNPCGFICDDTHSIFDHFPTEKTSNYQWRMPLEHSVTYNIDAFPPTFKVILEPVPNFFDNTRMASIFEAKVGNADILFAGFNFDSDCCEIKQLKASILTYINSDRFVPSQTLSLELVQQLFL